MRLTLRTMLAYLDEILEPADAEEIGKKIDESEFATDLVRRTRDVTRRLRLGAPPPMGSGMGGDPNTVAEYLDNTMPPEQVADFERVCLESDAHLAEVSACHQVLTLVLGEPAEVPPGSRERMYRIGESGRVGEGESGGVEEGERIDAPSPSRPLSPALSSAPKRRPKPEVPEYLRQGRRGRWRKAAAIFAAAALLGGGATALLTEPALWNGGGAEERVREGEKGGIEHGEVELASLPASPPESNGKITRPENAAEAESEGTKEQESEEASDLSPSPPLPLPPSPSPPVASSEAGEGGPFLDPAPNEEMTRPEKPAEEAPSVVPPLLDDSPRVARRGLEKPLKAQPDDEPSEAMPAEDEGVGVYVFDKNVLLRADPKSGKWTRIGQAMPLKAGDKLLSPPPYRNTIKLGGATLQLVGDASVVLGETDDEGARQFELLHGRVVLSSAAGEDAAWRIELGDEQHRVVLDGGSTLAVELRRLPVLGQDPQSAAAPAAVDLYASRGQVEWKTRGKTTPIQSPAHWKLSEAPAPAESSAESMPPWIAALPLSVNDRRAMLTVEAALTPDQAPAPSLAELTTSRRLEVRDLATRTSVCLGQFEPFVTALNDADQHSRWDRHIETLRATMARDPQAAHAARETLVARRGEEGPALYRMLWGYTNAQLADGAAKQLVEYLDHESLDYRVLAFWNLRDIAGYGLNYRPEFPPTRRQQSVRRWQDLLEKGEIVRGEKK